MNLQGSFGTMGGNWSFSGKLDSRIKGAVWGMEALLVQLPALLLRLPCAGPQAPENSSAELVEPAGFLRIIAVRVLLLLRSRRVEIQCWLLQVNKPLPIPTSPMCLEIAFLDGY